jgi:hypothetical protein
VKQAYRIVQAAAVTILLFASVISPAASPSLPILRQAPSAPAAVDLSREQWARDIDALTAELPKLHKNLFARLSEAEFRKDVDELKIALPSLAPDAILVRALRLIASIGDSHTGLGYRPAAAFPLMTYWYDDGIWIQNTIASYGTLLRGRITAIDGHPMEDVTTALASLIPHENEAQVRGQLPALLTDPAVLHGLSLISRPDAARFTVRDAAGAEHSADLRPLATGERPAWAVDMNAEYAAFQYLMNRQKDYWFLVMPRAKSLYFQYNVCRDTSGLPFAAFVEQMFAAADAAGVERVIVDLRLNGGGNSAVFQPFKTALKTRPALNRKGALFVLIGRRTFSSALMNAVEMKLETPAILVGEPTGGKPNHFGEVRTFALPGSGRIVSYSTRYFKEVAGDPLSLEPDVRVKVDFADHLARRDPVIDAALVYGR